MSVQAITWAKAARVGCPLAKLVLLSLADHAGFDNTCFPAIKTIAHDMELSKSTVLRALRRLEELKLITRERRKRADGQRTSNLYLLHLVSAQVSIGHLGQVSGGAGQVSLQTPQEPSLIEPKNRNGVLGKGGPTTTARPALAEISQDDRRVPHLRRERVKLIPTTRFTYIVDAKALAAIAA